MSSRGNLDIIVSKREVSAIFEITGEVTVFVRNLKQVGEIYPYIFIRCV